ncbi:MAG: prepilin-type N-terminal cleavage/methylation domain-containing protein, partial [Clostridiales Family XIII bacterium]|nr:prepilin-type N-terminal cleavage/methylation domain-containing protein [Clostridiales Family XIII bacterium]
KAVTHHRKGFTLVEVIVVLVILAILAAIAIPALTGYIDKAKDKEWIAKARNVIVAYRTILDESYANGTFNEAQKKSIQDGNITSAAIKAFYGTLSGPWNPSLQTQINRLVGWDEKNYSWGTFGPYSPDTTALNADGFNVSFHSEAIPTKDNASSYSGTITMVTYKLKHLNGISIHNIYIDPSWQKNNFKYDPNAGYEVYHLSNS